MESQDQVTTSDQQKVTRPMSFVSSFDKQSDMLVNAVCVARFLSDLAPAMTPNGNDLGLSEDGGQGLCLILNALENTIQAALELVDFLPQSPTA